MKTVSLIKYSIISILVCGLLIGCGGGSSSDSTSLSTATLSSENADLLGTNAAELLPGCVYTSDSAATTTEIRDVKNYQVMLDQLLQKEATTKTSIRLYSTTIDETNYGDCGGTLTVNGTHDNGDDDVVYTYSNYCTDDGTTKTIMNGALNVYVNGEPSPTGPIIQDTTLSTNSSGLSMEMTTDGQTVTETLYLSNYKAIAANETGTDEASGTQVTADQIKIVSSANGTYEADNVSFVSYGSDIESFLKIYNATYIDPEVGAVSISTSAIPNNEGATGSGTITVTSNDSSATFSCDDVSTGLYTLEQDGITIGALDCNTLVAN